MIFSCGCYDGSAGERLNYVRSFLQLRTNEPNSFVVPLVICLLNSLSQTELFDVPLISLINYNGGL